MEPTPIVRRRRIKCRPKLEVSEKISIVHRVIHKLDPVKEVA